MKTTLKEGEQIILNVKKHWVTVALPFIVLFFIVFLLISSPEPLRKLLWGIAPYAIAASFVFIAYSCWVRKTSLIIVTNFRVIREWGIFSYNVKESLLSMINNITVRQDPLGIVFGYGDVQIQTAAEYGVTTDKFIENPKKLQATIFRAKHAYKGHEQFIGVQSAATPEPSGVDARECPFCFETIKKKARVCRFCGRNIPAEAAGDIKGKEGSGETEALSTVAGKAAPEDNVGAAEEEGKVYGNYRDYQRDDLASLLKMPARKM